MRWLAPTSAFGITALIFALAVTLEDASAHANRIGHQLRSIPLVKWDTYPLFLGNAAFLWVPPHTVTAPPRRDTRRAAGGQPLTVPHPMWWPPQVPHLDGNPPAVAVGAVATAVSATLFVVYGVDSACFPP